MINVQLGSKQEEKPFPKLMKGDDESLIFVLSPPNDKGYAKCLVIKRTDFDCPYFAHEFNLSGVGGEKFTDYNEPVTLQNA